MEQVAWQQVSCPYCGERFGVALDHSAGEQAFIEDCRVCCRPIEMHWHMAGMEWCLEVRRDDD